MLQAGPAQAQEVSMEKFVTLTKPVGLTWVDGSFIASSREGNITKLVKISLDGKIEPFAPSFKGEGEVYIAVSPGKAGFPQGYLYVLSGNSIYEIDPTGSKVRFFSRPLATMGLGYIAFDTEGTWGNLLYAVNFNGPLWKINSSGNATLIADLGNNLLPESIAFAPKSFGGYAGDMVVSLEMGRKVIALSQGNPLRATVLVEFRGESPERVLVVPPDSDMYAAKYDANEIVKVTANHFAGYNGSLVVLTEGEAGEKGSITLLKANGTTIAVAKMVEGLPSPHFEGVEFVPLHPAKTVTELTTVQNLSTGDFSVLGIMAVALIVLAGIFVWTRRRPRQTGM
ncbi:MAG: hypothetical protein M1387_09260 [Thaumarchaeota archaeon]|nr:hypothetical protein [Nitrososphaerota archaeon]